MTERTPLNDQLHWYKDAIIYEVHVKSFCDSNGNGIGDFNGLIQKLDYLQGLGITAIWLLPFYPSPLKDDGYDIADYYNINPAYGEIGHFKKFLKEAHKRHLKVIIELVINHTSDQHPWFQKARRAPTGSPERNFYVWSDNPHQYREARIIFQDFEASNWTWDPVAQQYYWHRFFHHQPDLNFDNPMVQEEVFSILDYWCKMGVDGFRLDAVPYLFEREGTNCENLPETHAFLKKLRAHVDRNCPGTLLLAEANMWPEDSAAYFGNGDECHMNYHFPVMPRMFMALQMEDRYPITDIFDQTPDIPQTCQWAMFLRNHDELTLEMVTDEERDYMYKVYVKDPKARINLGIRHRLASLTGNNRRKIELLNNLLFSLPGTPVIYYGDEIGMGDNFYLGDRDGVRTPMQWTADRNAGFSTCEPYKLYLPVILDPEYHFHSVNVDVQSKNSSSLLCWMKRLIHTRKTSKAFGRGNIRFLEAENSQVLAFTRSYENETVLVVANFSRYVQPLELSLDGYEGHVPVEMFSKNKFPAVKKGQPYFLALGALECQWLQLKKTDDFSGEKMELPRLELKKWKAILSGHGLATLEEHILPQYLINMRWFGGKGRGIHTAKIVDCAKIDLKEEKVFLLLVEVTYESGLPDIYQLPISFCSGKESEALEKNYPKAVLSRIKIKGKEGVLYDATFGTALQGAIFRAMATEHAIELGSSKITFAGSDFLKGHFQNRQEITSCALSTEQSNSCIIYADKFFLKIYRKVDRAINPDLEVTRFLATQGFGHIPKLAGSVEWQYDRGAMVLAMMQELVENIGDGWTYMRGQAEKYVEAIRSEGETKLPSDIRENFTEPIGYEDLPAYVHRLISPQLAEKANLLGNRTGQMHLALASAPDQPDFAPEPFTLHYQRSLFSSFQTLVRNTFQNQSRNLRTLAHDVKAEAREVLDMKSDILSVLRRIYRKKLDVVKVRTHGDYHLGQVLLTEKDVVILDFEGEPARSYSERRLKRSPLRDVAGMVRSFHYAAYSGLFLNKEIDREEAARLLPFAELWYRCMSGFFMKAYLETVQGSAFVPAQKEDLEVMMQTYILEKSIYELNYEVNNRPDWVIVPLRGIKSIMQQHTLNHEHTDKKNEEG